MTNNSPFEIAGRSITSGESAYLKIPVSHTLDGHTLYIPCHVIVGTEPGPALGLITLLHGDEAQPVEVIRRVWMQTEPTDLKGVLLAVPVANPFAFSRFERSSPEQHDGTNLNRLFPGKPVGSLTEMIAYAINQQILPRLDCLIDYHSGGRMGRLQNRVNCGLTDDERLNEKTREINRLFGTLLVQETNAGSGTSSHAAAQFGVPTCGVEVGGSYLASSDSEYFIDIMTTGTRNIMKHLGMLSGEIVRPEKQLIYSRKGRLEVKPKNGGYLLSKFEKPEDVGKKVKKGEVLGTLYDPYSFIELEALESPVDGLIFFSRLSGVLEAGGKAFGVADLQYAEWISN